MAEEHRGGDLYSRWNGAIARHFFRPEMAGRQVFLFVDEGVLSRLAEEHGLPEGSFLESVAGPGYERALNVATRCLGYCVRGKWRLNPRWVYPPYLAFLALFVLAAGTEEEDLPDSAYYSRLRRCLGLPDGHSLPDFARLGDEVWPDLAAWSTVDKDGQLGIFTVRVSGGFRHVGIPRAQTLLWEGEIDALPEVFAASGLDPSDDPSDDALAYAMRHHRARLRAVTCRVLDRPRADALRGALLDAVRAELDSWDGSLPPGTGTEDAVRVFGRLRICLELNEGNQTGCATLRCSLAHPYPDSPLVLQGSGLQLSCEELSPPWSSRLAAGDTLYDAASADWGGGLVLRERSLGWEFRLSPAQIRVFEPGVAYGLPGQVEAARLDREKPLYLACPPGLAPDVWKWAETCCETSSHASFAGSVPEGWALIKVRGIRDDVGIKAAAPALGLPSGLRVRLTGGLRSGRGATYFAFAPPLVSLSGGDGTETVTAGGRQLIETGPELYQLPHGLPLGGTVSIEAATLGGLHARATVVLLDERDWADPTPVRVDSFGEAGSEGSCCFCGAYADPAEWRSLASFTAPLALPAATKAVLLGRRPGEISNWPAEPLPAWQPTWAITPSVRGRRRRPVTYCGLSLKEAGPLPGEALPERMAGKRWREEIWHRRKRNVPPSDPRQRELWQAYMRAAQK